jgi:hypothetical protein
MSRLRGSLMGRPVWIGLTVVTLVLWAAATIFAIRLPVFETGTDPTRIPFGAIFSPVAAAMLTALAGFISIVFGRGPWGGQPDPRGDGP